MNQNALLRRRRTSFAPNEVKGARRTGTNKENNARSKNVVVTEDDKENNGSKKRAAAKEQIKSKKVKKDANQKKEITHQKKETNQQKKDKKETNQKKEPEVLQIMSPTPYYQIVQARGGEMSPRITRSSAKKKRFEDDEEEEEEEEDHTSLPKGVVLTFSPPNQAENERREKEELERKMKARDKRVGNCRDSGNLLEFSPTTLRPYQYFADQEPPHEKQQQRKGKNCKAQQGSKEDLVEQQTDMDELHEAIDELEVTMQTASSRSQVSAITSIHEQSQNQEMAAEVKRLGEKIEKFVTAQDTETVDSERAQRAEREALMAANIKLEKKNEKLEEQMKSLTAKQETFLVEKTRLQAELDTSERVSKTRIEGLEKFGQKQEEQLLKLEQEKKSLTEQVESLRKQLETEKLEKQIMLVRQSEKEQEQKLSEVASQQLQHRAELQENLETACNAKEDLEIELRENAKAMAEYEKKFEDSEEKLQQVMEELDEERQNVEEMNRKCDEYVSQIETLKKDIQNAQKENENVTKHLEEMSSANKKLLDRMEGGAEEKDSQINALQNRVRQLEEELEAKKDSCNAHTLELENVKAELERCKKALEEATVELEETKQSQMKFSFELETNKTELENCKRALEETTNELFETEQSKTVLEGKLDRALKQAKAAAAVSELEKSLELERELKQRLEQSKQELELLNKELEARAENLENLAADLEKEVEDLRSVKDERTKELEARVEELEDLVKALENKIKDLNSVKDERDDALVELGRKDIKLQENDKIRRDLHSRVMQLSGNIRVYIRVRPSLPGEEEDPKEELSTQKGKKRRRNTEVPVNDCPFRFPGVYDRHDDKRKSRANNTIQAAGADDLTKNIIEIHEPYKDRGGLSDRRKKWRYGFDNVFSPENGQEEVWEATEPLIQSAIDGYNVTIFAYGQTGTGKTYTMLGEPDKEGIIGRAVKMLFNAKKDIQELYSERSDVKISIELLEVYNDQVRDLLAKNSSDRGTPLKINIDKDVVGNVVVPASTEKDVMDVLDVAQTRRCVKSTACNAESSRSHMIFTLHFEVTMKEGIQRTGRLNICDLAGSERLSKSGAHNVGGDLLKETKCINSSLSVLSNVIEKLQAGSSNVPYRESKLTHLLQNSLGGNSKTLAIVCCNPSGSHFHESLCSLKFAEKVNRVELKDVANFSC